MPNPSSAVESSAFLKLLVLGAPKVGKTQTIISTSPGPVYVISSDDKHSLKSAARVCEFTWDFCPGGDLTVIEKCLHEARSGVKEGRYKTIVWDTLTEYARRAQDVYEKATMNSAGESDGRRFWPQHRRHIVGILDRLLALNCHVIVNAHFTEVSGATIEGQIKKSGEGTVPSLGGQLRTQVPGMFQDVVFLEKRKVGDGVKRFFITSSDGVFGPGCRNLPGRSEVEGDVGELWKAMAADVGAIKKKKRSEQ